jgi:hypothetical protein
MTLARGLAPAVVEALLADEGVAALVGMRVYERDIASAVFPYVAFAALKGRAWNAGGERGEEIVFALHCAARAGGRDMALDVARACAAALEGAALSWSGAHVVALFFSEAEAAQLKDGETWRATARFRALVEEV